MAERPTEDDQAARAIWFNKREVTRIDFAAEHTLGPENDGWRLTFSGHGSMRLDLAQGPKESFAVVEGDSLLSMDEDFYLTLHSGDGRRTEREEKAEARKSARDQAAEKKAAGRGAKKAAR